MSAASHLPVPRAPNSQRRKLIGALGLLQAAAISTGVAGALWLPAQAAYAATSTSVIEGLQRWLFAGWESVSDAALPECMQVLDLIQTTCAKLAARQIRCVVVVAPLKAAVYSELLPPDASLSAAVAGRFAALLQGARQRQIALVDALSALAPLKASADGYIRADYHWSAHTAEAVASQTAALIQAAGPLGGTPGSGRKLGAWTEEYHYGDLAELLPAAGKKDIGKDRFVVRATVTSQDLLGDAPPVVQVVGNSMVQPYLGFSQKLSNALDRPVGLSWAFGDVGPWKMLLNYLQSPAFHTQAPQTIVWQFNEGQFMHGPNAALAYDPASLLPAASWLEQIGQALG